MALPQIDLLLNGFGAEYGNGTATAYLAGTSTLATWYTDAGGTTPAANPYTLSGTGTATLYCESRLKIDVKNSVGVSAPGFPIDNIGFGNQANAAWIFAADYGASKNDTTISAALAVIGASTATLYCEPGTWTIANNLTIPSNVVLKSDKGTLYSIDTGKTLTINSDLEYVPYQIFTGSGSVAGLDVTYPENFGAVGDGSNDDTTSIQKALDATTDRVYIRAGKYKLTSALSVTNQQNIEGAGIMQTVLIQTGTTADGVYFNNSVLTAGGGIAGLSLHAGSFMNTNTGSTGVGLNLLNSNGNFKAENIEVMAFATGIKVKSSFYAAFTNGQILYARDAGLLLASSGAGTNSAGTTFTNWKISNYGFTGVNTSSIGIKIEESSGDYLNTIDVTSFNTGIQIKPISASEYVTYLFMSQVLADTSVANGFELDGSTSSISACAFHDCWSGFNGAIGLLVKGTVEGCQWIGGRIRENGTHGVSLDGGTAITFSGTHINKNSQLANNTYYGVNVTTNHISSDFTGCRIANFASGLTNGQLAAFNVPSTFTGAIGYPAEFQLNYTFSSVSAGTTLYAGVNGSSAAEATIQFTAPRNGTITYADFQCQAAPGAGQSFTYTVRVNGIDTALSGAIIDTGTFSKRVFGNVSVARGDAVSVKIVTSGAAAVTSHRGVILMTGLTV